MGLTIGLSDPFFTGTSPISQAVPGGKFPVAIAGRTYILDTESNEFRRQSIPLLRGQVDQSQTLGEQSISADDLWRRARESWHHGAGQSWADRADSDPARFRASKGVDVWTKWEASLLNSTSRRLTSGQVNLSAAVAGAYLYVTDGATVRYTTDLANWATVGGTPTEDATSISSDGNTVYIAYPSGIWTTTRGSAAASQYVSIGVAAFQPLSIPALEAHWVDDPNWSRPADGAAVSTWRDGSGNTRSADQGTGANQPIMRASSPGMGGRAVVEFDGTDDTLASTVAASTAQPIELVAVLRMRTVAGSKTLFDSGTTMKLRSNASSRWSMNAGAAFASTVGVDTSSHFVHLICNGASSELRLDGTTIASGNAGANAWQGFTLGATAVGTEFSAVDLHFIAAYQTLTNVERDNLRSFFQSYVGTP